MEVGLFGWLVVLLGVTAGLSATPWAASATSGLSRAALASKGDGASPFRGGPPGHAGGWPFGVEQTQDIVGGLPATNSENPGDWSLWFGEPQVSKWPWIAMLRAKPLVHGNATSDNAICGGCLINSRFVLTAAHCMEAHIVRRDSLVVRLGEFDSRTTTDGNHTDYQVEAILTHPNYRDNQSNHDIALLRLAKEVKFSAGVCTIPLPDGPTGDLAKANLTFAGWGKTHGRAAEGSPILQELNVTAVSEDKCLNEWAIRFPELKWEKQRYLEYPLDEFPDGFLAEKKICTLRMPDIFRLTLDCGGDSGGPLVEYGKFRVVGVLSTSYSGLCDNPYVPTLFTRVSAYLDWIQKTVNKTAGVKTQHCQNTFIHAG